MAACSSMARSTRVRQRAVGGETQEGPGRSGGVQGADEASQHVVQRAAMATGAELTAIAFDSVVLGGGAGCDHQPGQAARAAQPFDLPAKHRRAQNWPQDLARQAAGGHARLQDGENHDLSSRLAHSCASPKSRGAV